MAAAVTGAVLGISTGGGLFSAQPLSSAAAASHTAWRWRPRVLGADGARWGAKGVKVAKRNIAIL
jgi:hypothetical protein